MFPFGILALATGAPAPAAPLARPGCEWTGPSGYNYDFTPLIAPVGTDHSIAGSFVDRKFTYFYNWCAGVVPRDSPPGSPPGIGCDSTDAVCQDDDEYTFYYSLGKLDKAVWAELPDRRGVTIRYAGGSEVWAPAPRQTLVTVLCGTTTTYGPARSGGVGRGIYFVNITTPLACPKAPPTLPTTCQQVLYENPAAADGEYELECAPANVQFNAYCSSMATGRPKEYLTLPAGKDKNFAAYLCGAECKGNDPGSTTVTTNFWKLRVNPCTLKVDVSDRAFASSTGRLVQDGSGRVYDRLHAATAQSCEGGTAGSGEMDVSGTGLVFDTRWRLYGASPFGTTTLSADKTGVKLTGGGYCGFNGPDGYNDYDDFDRPQYVLQLAKGPPVKPPAPPAPPAPSDIEWSLAPAQTSCAAHCTAQPRGPSCVETDWPSSEAEFRVVLEQLPTGFCGSITADEGSCSPFIRPDDVHRRANLTAVPTVCYWRQRGSGNRCDEPCSAPQDQRFCPCKDPEVPASFQEKTL